KLTYKRSSGHLTVWVEWGTESKYIKNFLVKYREFNTTKWKEQQSKNNKECVLWNLTPSLPYELQTQCVPNKECAQCPLSKYANSEAVANYSVTVRKVSGEPSNRDSFSSEDSSLTLILSYSAYNISIRALNSAGSSPVSSIAIEQMDEWRAFSKQMFFFGLFLNAVFQPYTRYYFFLHIRPYQDTCNMKNVNDSETTYGTAQTYFTEGSPISAPGNVSILNITQHSSVITWSPVSEEDLRGFLLGYCIYLTEDNNETSFKVDPSMNSYELQNLESNSAHRVLLSAFTAAGEGERSDFTHFVTKPPEFTALNSIIAAVVVGIIILLLAVHFSFRLLHRAKKLLWPSIPNPENSNAVQKIEIAYELSNSTVSDFVPASQPAVVFMSDYTTMEIFQQVTMTGIQGPSIQTVKPGLVAVHPGQDYVQQSYFLQEIAKEPPGAFNGTDFLNPEITVL
ncbi:leukemia inhibitory factor receptor-like, partial [Sinocyclocheilus grahami]|uniref:leukemia inhibitory factor receptor-like n=1 Tax=Sinocyclocheilus grahami TaxID=75366 RepID=UPI0007ACC897